MAGSDEVLARLRSDVWAVFQTGLRRLAEPEHAKLVRRLAKGAYLDREGFPTPGSGITRLVSGHYRATAFVVLTLTGRLKRARRLSLSHTSFVDMSWLAGLSGLRDLDLSSNPLLRDVSALAELPALRSLNLMECRALRDISPLAELPALVTLRIGAYDGFRVEPLTGLEVIGPLARCAALKRLTLRRCTEIRDGEVLASLPALESLDLTGSDGLLPPESLASLPKLRDLDLSRWTLADLRTIERCRSIESLALRECPNLTDLSSLRTLPRLRALSVGDCPKLVDLRPLRDVPTLAEGVSVDSRGRVTRDGGTVKGEALTHALWAAPDRCVGARALDFEHCHAIKALPPMERFTKVERLVLHGCVNLTDLREVAHLVKLDYLDISETRVVEAFGMIPMTRLNAVRAYSNCLRPVLKPSAIDSVAAVTLYREKLARALKRKKNRDAAEDALLERAYELGLVARPKSKAKAKARRGSSKSRAEKRASEQATRAAVAAIRKLLASADLAVVREGAAQLLACPDKQVAATFAKGTTIDMYDHVEPGPLIRRVVKQAHREWVALVALRAAGALAEVEVLDYKGHLRELALFDGLPKLKSLNVGELPAELDLAPLGRCQALRTLGVDTLGDRRALPSLAACPQLTELIVSDSPSLEDLSALNSVASMKRVNLASCPRVRDFSVLGQLPALEWLYLGGNTRLRSLECLAGATALKWLSLGKLNGLVDIGALARLRALETLWISECAKLVELAPLRSLHTLRTLGLTLKRKKIDLSPLGGLRGLTQLRIGGPQLADLSPLSGLESLEELWIFPAPKIVDLAPLAGLRRLKRLDIVGSGRLVDIAPLAGLTQLESLQLAACKRLRDLSPLAGLSRLTTLDLSECSQLVDITPLASLRALEALGLGDCRRLRDVSPLQDLPALSSITFSYDTKVRPKPPEDEISGRDRVEAYQRTIREAAG